MKKEAEEFVKRQDQILLYDQYKYFDKPSGADYRLFSQDTLRQKQNRKEETIFQTTASLYPVEKKEALKRQQMHTRMLLGAAVAVLLLLTIAFASVACKAIGKNEVTLSHQVAAQFPAHLNHKLDSPSLLNGEPLNNYNTAEACSSLSTGLEYEHTITTFLYVVWNSVYSLAFSPDGKILAAGTCQSTIFLLDVETCEQIGEPLHPHNVEVVSVTFSPDGKLLASDCGKTIILWDVENHQPIGPPLTGHKDWVISAAFSPDGKILASGSSDETIILWDVETRQPIGKPLTGHKKSVRSISFSPNGKILASGSADETIILWDVETRQPIGLPLAGHSSRVDSVAFSPDGKILISGSSDATIILWGVETRQPIGEPLTWHNDYADSIAFSPDGKTLALSFDSTIILWDIETRQQIGQSFYGGSATKDGVSIIPSMVPSIDCVNCLTFSPDGKILASGDDKSFVILWDVETQKPIAKPFSTGW
jgi:WD40 repeat protein